MAASWVAACAAACIAASATDAARAVARVAEDIAATNYEWRLPPGFPPPAVPLDNPMSAAKVALGRRLFFEKRLSSSGRYSCSSCHRPELAFTDGQAHARGATGESVRRGAMTLTNVAYNPAFTWSSDKLRSLESQMRQPLFNEHPVEMGLRKGAAVAVNALTADPNYRAQFVSAFPGDTEPLTLKHTIQAIAAFERTLISGRSAFDRYVFDDDQSALSDSAKHGMALFYSARVGCGQCHSGINFTGTIVYEGHARAQALFANTGLYALDARGAYPASDRGLIEVTHRGADMGKFKVPTLRNVALTAPYMHDGSLPTLDAVLDHYVRGGRKNPLQDVRVRPFVLSQSERADLVEFLKSLTDHEFIENPEFSDPN